MKRTSSMNYTPSGEANDLYLYATNTGELYPYWQNIETMLDKKVKAGKFNADKAIDAFYMVIQEAAKLYKKELGAMFTVTERFTAACMMRDDYVSDMEANA